MPSSYTETIGNTRTPPDTAPQDDPSREEWCDCEAIDQHVEHGDDKHEDSSARVVGSAGVVGAVTGAAVTPPITVGGLGSRGFGSGGIVAGTSRQTNENERIDPHTIQARGQPEFSP